MKAEGFSGCQGLGTTRTGRQGVTANAEAFNPLLPVEPASEIPDASANSAAALIEDAASDIIDLGVVGVE